MSHRGVEASPVGAVPLREVSALAVTPAGGRTRLLAVGDHTPEIAVAELSDAWEPGPWQVVDPRTFDGPQEHAPDAQLEAVACDGSGVVVLLAEEPARLHVLDLDGRRLLTSVRLDVTAFADLAAAWDADPSSRGEGLLLLRGGHVVVAKEKHPPGLIEFGPQGDQPYGLSSDSLLGDCDFAVPLPGRLVALAWWPWPRNSGIEDISELAMDRAGGVHLLSDQSAAVLRLRLPLLPGGEPEFFGLERVRPKDLNHGKPEGLVVLGDGSRLVACDAKKAGRALLRLAPPS